jgi:uncharacterized membrane protein
MVAFQPLGCSHFVTLNIIIIISISGFGGCHLESVINSVGRHRPEVEITFERKKILVAASLNFVCRRMSGYVGRVISESGVVENVR